MFCFIRIYTFLYVSETGMKHLVYDIDNNFTYNQYIYLSFEKDGRFRRSEGRGPRKVFHRQAPSPPPLARFARTYQQLIIAPSRP